MLLAAAVVSTLTLPRHAVFGAAVVDKPAGLTVARVLPNTAASAAGLRTGDVIVRFAGVATPNVSAYLAEVHVLHASDAVTVDILRNNLPLTLNATLRAPPDEIDADVTTIYGAVTIDGTLRRTLLTVPKSNASRRPAVLFIGGIGCYSVDVGDPEDPYLHLAHDLSRNGFVTMRLEKSGVGDSRGPPCYTTDFKSEEYSYAIALAALQRDPHVDPHRVFLFGHSIGTVIAPQLAKNAQLAGIIVAEAVGRDWFEYELRNVRRQLELSGASPSDVDAGMSDKYICMYRLLVAGDAESAIEASMPVCKDANGVYPVDAAYVRQVAALNIIAPWMSLNVPVLAIYGRSDFVTEEADHARIVAVVNAAHTGSATLRVIDGMDHFLLRSPSAKDALTAYNKEGREYDTDLSDAIVAWLRAQI